ncbi:MULTISPECIES: hypothetical protein [Streptomyces]|uniref:Uncharacterized protein n=1 Tax=Streptomyces griseocarneus TaxID=51201 RepID=A0ABX7RV69_9ACTN|nr:MULTISPECIES: hypothetical protein [Streptomyces]QSY51418.1 hypothetical protein J3S04_11425 [Streptomyces griseocarneus]
MQELVEWERKFRIWHYSVSFSQLLLRSVNVDEHDSRVDVLFSNVKALHLPTSFDRLRIDRLEGPEIQEVIHEELQDLGRTKVFLLNGAKFFVQATHCQWHEDIGGPSTPSRFGPFRRVE